MKRFFLLSTLLFGFFAASFAQTSTNITATNTAATVRKISGKGIFYMCEPDKEYEVVFKKTILIMMGINTGEDIATTLAAMCEKEGRKEKIEYDAVIVQGVTGTAIKFK